MFYYRKSIVFLRFIPSVKIIVSEFPVGITRSHSSVLFIVDFAIVVPVVIFHGVLDLWM